MSALDDAVAACKATGTAMPAHLAAFLVARELEHGMSWDQTQLGQALFDLMRGPGPDRLTAILTRMVHPDEALRWPRDGKALREALDAYALSTGQVVSRALVNQFLARIAGMPRPMDSGEWLTSRAQLDASGRVVDESARSKVKTAANASAAAFEPPRAQEEALELDLKPKKPTGWAEPAPYRDTYKWKERRDTAVKLAIAFAVLAALTLGAFVAFPTLQRELPFLHPASAAALIVTTDPDGADVRVAGQVIGKTPFAGDNRWKGKVKLELELTGYETFKDTFEGGKEQHLGVTLKRKK